MGWGVGPALSADDGAHRTAESGPRFSFLGRPSCNDGRVRLWRLTREGQTALDGAGTTKHGGRYSPPGVPVVNFASEAGLAVLVALRYLSGSPADAPSDYVLGWTETDAIPERAPDAEDDAVKEWVARWLSDRRSLLVAVKSKVLPEADA